MKGKSLPGETNMSGKDLRRCWLSRHIRVLAFQDRGRYQTPGCSSDEYILRTCRWP